MAFQLTDFKKSIIFLKQKIELNKTTMMHCKVRQGSDAITQKIQDQSFSKVYG